MQFFYEPPITISTGMAEVAPLVADSTPALDIKIHFQPDIAFSPSTWVTVAPSPIPRFEAQEAVVNGKLYVFGGFVNSKLEATKRSDVYDQATDTWTQLPDLPQAITHAGVAVDGSTIYMAGGFVGNWPTGIAKTVFKYNVTSKTWSMGPSLPQPRGAGALVRLGRELHFFGGLNADKTADRPLGIQP